MAAVFTSRLNDCFINPGVSVITLACVMEPLLTEAYGKHSVAEMVEQLLNPPKRHWGSFRYDAKLQELGWSISEKVVADDYAAAMKLVVDRLEPFCERGTLRATWASETKPVSDDYPVASRGVMGKERGAGLAVAKPYSRFDLPRAPAQLEDEETAESTSPSP